MKGRVRIDLGENTSQEMILDRRIVPTNRTNRTNPTIDHRAKAERTKLLAFETNPERRWFAVIALSIESGQAGNRLLFPRQIDLR